MIFEDFLENLFRFGLEYFRKYYGPYRALVIDNKDPAGQGRILVACPRARISGSNGVWLSPMMHGAGKNSGVFWPPVIDDAVWIFFDNGDPLRPLGYMGGWYSKGDLSTELAPNSSGSPEKRGFITPGGNRIVLDDTTGSETITISRKDGCRVRVGESKVSIGSKNGSYEPMMRGSTAKKWMESHTHPHSFGPTGTPIVPFPIDGLSDDTETS